MAAYLPHMKTKKHGGNANLKPEELVAALAAITSVNDSKHRAVTAVQACEMLGNCSRRTLSRWIRRRLIRRSKATRHFLIPLSEIERFLKETLQ